MHKTEPSDQTSQREDARALQLRLYRELGLTAVAEAIAVAIPADSPASRFVRHTPAILVGEDKAA